MTEVVYGNLRLLSDRLLLKPLDWQGEAVHGEGARLYVMRNGRALRGKVIAVGPGHHPIKYKSNALGKKAKMDYSKHFRPTEVKVGDIVELGGLNIFDGKGYQFTEVLYNGENHIICSERDVALVVEDARAA